MLPLGAYRARSKPTQRQCGYENIFIQVNRVRRAATTAAAAAASLRFTFNLRRCEYGSALVCAPLSDNNNNKNVRELGVVCSRDPTHSHNHRVIEYHLFFSSFLKICLLLEQ